MVGNGGRRKSFKCFTSSSSSIVSDMVATQLGSVTMVDDSASDSLSEKQYEEDLLFVSRPSFSSGSRSSGNDSRCLLSFKAHAGGICSLAVSGEMLYTGSEDGVLGSFRLVDLKEMDRFGASSNGSVKSIVVSSSSSGSRVVLSAHQDQKIRAWKADSGANHHRLRGTLPSVRDSLSGAVLKRSGAYVRVRRHRKCLWNQHFDTISCLAVDQRAGMLYSGSWDRSIKCWSLGDYRCLQSIDAHTDAINAIAVVSGVVVSGSADSSIKVWARRNLLTKNNKKKKTQLHLVDELEQGAPINCLAVSGCWLYSGCSDGRITVWMITSEGDDDDIPVEAGDVTASPGSVYEYEDETHEQMSTPGRRVVCEGFGVLEGHSKAVLGIGAAGDVVCSGSGDRSVRVWRRGEDGEHVCIAVLLEGHNRCGVKSVMVSVEEVMGACIVYSGGLDGFVKVWWVSLASSSGGSSQTGDHSSASSSCSASGKSRLRLLESPCSVLDYRNV